MSKKRSSNSNYNSSSESDSSPELEDNAPKYKSVEHIEQLIEDAKRKKDKFKKKRLQSLKGKESTYGLNLNVLSDEERELTKEINRLKSARRYRINAAKKREKVIKNSLKS